MSRGRGHGGHGGCGNPSSCIITMFIGSALILGLLRGVRDTIKHLPGGKSFVNGYYQVSQKIINGNSKYNN